MFACIQGGNELKSIIVTMYADRITIEFTQWHPDTCAADLFHQLGGRSRMELIEAQATYHPLTKLELVTNSIQNQTFQHELDIAAGEYWDKSWSRVECINHLIEVALQFIPAHLNIDRLLRREVNQDFRLRIAI